MTSPRMAFRSPAFWGAYDLPDMPGRVEKENDMGIMSRLHWKLFCEPAPESEYSKMVEQEERQMERERETLYWEVDCEACPIDLKEKETRVKEKCARVAQILRAKKGRASH